MHCKHSEAAHAQCHARSHSGGGRGHKDLRSTHWSYSIFPLVQSTAVDKPTNGYLFTLFHEEKALYSCTSPPFSPQQPAQWQALHSKLFRFSAQWRSQSDLVMTQRTDAQFTELHQCWGRERGAAWWRDSSCPAPAHLLHPVCEPQQSHLQDGLTTCAVEKRAPAQLSTGPEKVWSTVLTPELSSPPLAFGSAHSRTDYKGGWLQQYRLCQRKAQSACCKTLIREVTYTQLTTPLTNLDTNVYSSFICNSRRSEIIQSPNGEQINSSTSRQWSIISKKRGTAGQVPPSRWGRPQRAVLSERSQAKSAVPHGLKCTAQFWLRAQSRGWGLRAEERGWQQRGSRAVSGGEHCSPS